MIEVNKIDRVLRTKLFAEMPYLQLTAFTNLD